MSNRDRIQHLKASGMRPCDISREVGCHVSLVYYHTDEKRRRRNIERLIKLKKDNKIKSLELKGGKCIKCGYSRCPAALVFHHIDPGEKQIRIGGVAHVWGRLEKELGKTVLLCNRCHAELHDGCWSVGEIEELGVKEVGYYSSTGIRVLPPSKTKSNWMRVDK